MIGVREAFTAAVRLQRKYLVFGIAEMVPAVVLDVAAVYASLANMITVINYVTFILPAIPVMYAVTEGVFFARLAHWLREDLILHYIFELPISTEVFTSAYILVDCAFFIHLPLIPIYGIMYYLGVKPLDILAIAVVATLVHFTLASIGWALGVLIREWHTSLVITGALAAALTVFSPITYPPSALMKVSPHAYAVMASNPLTMVVNYARALARGEAGPHLILAMPLAAVATSLLSNYVVDKVGRESV